MTSTLSDVELADIGRDFLALDEYRRAVYLDECNEAELEMIELAVTVAERRGADWHETPATMAHHLTRGEYHLYDYVKLMAASIADACTGGHPNRMIWIPSQMGKTTLLANWTPIWLLDRNPKLRIMYVSYDADKAVEEAGKARDLVEEHAGQLNFRLRPDRKARGRWLTPQGGGMYAVGINGGITGWPVDAMLLDDLYKGWVAAHSPTIRATVRNIYATQIRLRVQSRFCPKIYATTRWHEDDLPDSLLNKSLDSKVVDEWRVLRLAARAELPDPKARFDVYRLPDPLGREPGQVIEPARFDEQEVAARSAGMSSYLANALEQQKPTPEEGDELKRAWFRIRDAGPARFDLEIASWDMKLKDNEAGDFVVGGCWGRAGSAMWLTDVLRGQWNQATTENAIALMAVRHPRIRMHYIENTGNGPEVMTALRMGRPGYEVSAHIAGELGMTADEIAAVTRLRRQGMGKLFPVNVKGSKSVRMRAVSGSIEGGDVYLLDRAWTDAYLDEMAAFGPNAAHDDQVDMTSQAIARLLQGAATVTRAEGSIPKTSIDTRGGGTTGVTLSTAVTQGRARVRSASRVVVPRGVPKSGR